MRTEIEFYNLGLFKFKNDAIILDNVVLNNINNNLLAFFKSNSLYVEENEKWDFYVFKLINCCEKMLKYDHIWSNDWDIFKSEEIEFGYYHHRFFFQYKIKSEKKDLFKNLRDLRKNFKKYTDALMEKIKDEINKAVINEEQKVIYYYTYLFIIVKGYTQKQIPDISTTVEFEIIRPYIKFSIFQPIYNIRISSPSIILYSNRKKFNKNMHYLMRNITNNIYQNLLYKKKIKDIENNKHENIIEENQLIEMWEKIMDFLGGKSTDFNIIRLSRLSIWMMFLSILIIILTIITIIPYLVEIFKFIS